jgi:hypothetical protein
MAKNKLANSIIAQGLFNGPASDFGEVSLSSHHSGEWFDSGCTSNSGCKRERIEAFSEEDSNILKP